MTRCCLAFRAVLQVCAFGLVTSAAIAVSQPAATTPPGTDESIILGNSIVPLYGPWKFHIGDSPIDLRTGKPLWAEPDFDDSRWEKTDLTPKSGAIDPIAGVSGYVPGWTAKGHPGYWGYAWYRIRVQVQARPGQELSLEGPADLDDAYQVFCNGELIGHFGDFNEGNPAVHYTQPMMFPLTQLGSDSAKSSAESPSRVLAFRLWMEPSTLIQQTDPGGMHTAPVLGEASAVAASYQLRWLERTRTYSSWAAQVLLFGLLAVVAFSLILFDRSDRVYLWMGALFLIVTAYAVLVLIAAWTQWLNSAILQWLTDGLAVPLVYATWVMVWRVWFGLKRPSWLPSLTAGLALVLMLSNIVGEELLYGLVPHTIALHFLTVSLAARLALIVLLVWVVFEGIRRRGVEGWLVLPVVVLRAVAAFTGELEFLSIPLTWHPFGLLVNLGMIVNMLLGVLIALLLLRRLLQSVRRQRLTALDVKQAQEVQQVILPEARIVLPGLEIESEYRPAREVGGDFFQIIPNETNGSLLIVAGDVAGKGLKAGMLVALLVGAIRSTAELNDDPEFVLKALNKRLMGRGDALATCLALRIEADGSAALANSGHIAPYLNGEQLPIEGALPLGIIEAAQCSMMRFKLKQGDRLMLMSDGVAEATDADGHLFGFERVHEMLQAAKCAAEVASAAQNYGQEDDISVISVTCTALLRKATA